MGEQDLTHYFNCRSRELSIATTGAGATAQMLSGFGTLKLALYCQHYGGGLILDLTPKQLKAATGLDSLAQPTGQRGSLEDWANEVARKIPAAQQVLSWVKVNSAQIKTHSAGRPAIDWD